MLLESRFKALGVSYQNLKSEDFVKEFIYKVTKGMGVTLGNSLRRTLLSQISGYALRYLSINGVNHEFSSIAGMKESTQELIMNLKKIVYKGDISSTDAYLDVTRTGEVYASDLSVSGLSVVNDHLYICTLDNASLRLEMHIESGVGIILARDVNVQDFDRDVIVCDSFFSPIENVNFKVENIENNHTEEKLFISIQTNGSLTPVEAMDKAIERWSQEMAKISEKMVIPVNEEISYKQSKIFSDALSYKVSDIQGMTTRILNCIRSLNVTYVGELVRYSQKELLEKPNFGENSLNQLIDLLRNIGLQLGMDTTGWNPPVEEQIDDVFIR